MADDPDLIERGEVLAEVVALLDRARCGAGGVLVLEGPAGVGKTAILRAATRWASQSSIEVLRARGGELEAGFGLGVARQLLEPALQRRDGAARQQLLEGPAAWATQALGVDLRPVAPVSDPSFAVRHGLYALLDALATEAPVLLAIDDAQWADRSSLELLAYLAGRVADAAIAVVMTWRTGDPDPVLEAMRREETVRVRILTPLSPEGTAIAVRRALGTADDAFAQACHEATGGNPFLLHELVRAAQRDGVDPVAAEADRVRSLRSEAIGRDVLVRLANLSPSAARVAQAMAALGLDDDRYRIGRVAGLEPDRLTEAIASLQRAAVLAPDEPLRFLHPIVRSTIAGELTSGERDELHRRAAELFHADGDVASEAAHRAASRPAGDPRAVAALRRAASLAFASGAIDNAVALLERAVEEPPDDVQRAATLLELGTMRTRAGLDAADPLARARADTPDAASRALITQLIGFDLAQRGRLREAVDTLVTARQESGDPEIERFADLARVGISVLVHDDPVPLRTELARLVEELPEGSALHREALALQACEFSAHGEGTAEDVAALVLSARHDGVVDARWTSWAWFARVIALVYSGLEDEGAGYIDELVDGYSQIGNAVGLACAIAWQGQLAFLHGDISSARERVEHSLAIASHDRFRFARPWRAALLADVHRFAGDPAAAIKSLEDAYGSDDVEPDALNGVFVLLARASAEVERGRLDRARRDLEELERREIEAGGINVHVVNDVARLWHAVGEPDRAVARAEANLVAAIRWGTPLTVGRARRDLGALTFHDRGLDDLHEAVRILEATPHRLDLAIALVELGSALRRDGSRRAARDPLRRAVDIAVRGGAEAIVRRATLEYRATGAQARTLAVEGPPSLTPSERRVARLAAQGRSNVDIARELFVSRKTVETHLGSVYRKLGIDGRHALADHPDVLDDRGG